MPSKNLRNHFNEYSKTWATLGKFWTTLIVIRYVGQFCKWGKSLSKISKIIFFEARINDLMKTVKRGENVKKKTFSTRTTTGRIREMKMRVPGKLRIFPFSWLLSLSNFTNMYVINFLLWFFGGNVQNKTNFDKSMRLRRVEGRKHRGQSTWARNEGCEI